MTTAQLDHYGICPECGSDWSAGDIFTVLRAQDWYRDKTDEELQAFVRLAWSPPYKFSRLIGVELAHDHPQHYDGVSYWMCPDCKHQWPRFVLAE
jgi:rubredoxin